MTTQSTARPLFQGEPFERVIGLLIALVTLIAAVVGYLITDADARSGLASRQAQQYVIQALGQRAHGELTAGFGVSDVYRQWVELDTLARAADGERGDAAQRYRAARDGLTQLSPLLQAPYFDPAAGATPRVSAFEADTYVIQTSELTERFSNAFAVSDGWGEKSSSYTLQLTLLTISLFLYGLCLTITSRARWLFVALGTVLSMLTLIWLIAAIVQPVPQLPDTAMSAYARGVGLAYQDDFAGAAAAFTTAIEAAPDYANAYYSRANAHERLGQHAQAAEDYQLAQAAGRDDANVAWNLGWSYYLLGNFDAAEQATSAAIERAPDQAALYFNQGLARLAAGRLADAQAAYDTGTRLAADQVSQARAAGKQPPAALWWYITTAAADLNHLLDCAAPAASCDGAPPHTALSADAGIASAANALTRQLKSLAIGLEYTGAPPLAEPAARVGTLQFARGATDPAGKLIGYDPLDSKASNLRFGTVQQAQSEFAGAQLIRPAPDRSGGLYALFDFDQIKDGALLVVKLYSHDQELPGLRLAQKWSLGTRGHAALPITSPGYALAPGSYQAELYVDAQLVQQGSFILP